MASFVTSARTRSSDRRDSSHSEMRWVEPGARDARGSGEEADRAEEPTKTEALLMVVQVGEGKVSEDRIRW